MLGPGTRFCKVPVTSCPKSCLCLPRLLQDQSFNNFENDTMKLSANEAKLTALCTRNFSTIQKVLILKFAFGTERLPGLSRNGPLISYIKGLKQRRRRRQRERQTTNRFRLTKQ